MYKKKKVAQKKQQKKAGTGPLPHAGIWGTILPVTT